VVTRLLKERGIFPEPVDDKPYHVRFRQLQPKRAIQGMTHAKGTKISPRFLAEILDRFHIEVPDFLESLALLSVNITSISAKKIK
jgi:hypothetical protein